MSCHLECGGTSQDYEWFSRAKQHPGIVLSGPEHLVEAGIPLKQIVWVLDWYLMFSRPLPGHAPALPGRCGHQGHKSKAEKRGAPQNSSGSPQSLPHSDTPQTCQDPSCSCPAFTKISKGKSILSFLNCTQGYFSLK